MPLYCLHKKQPFFPLSGAGKALSQPGGAKAAGALAPQERTSKSHFRISTEPILLILFSSKNQ
jgi:hypothetical protein